MPKSNAASLHEHLKGKAHEALKRIAELVDEHGRGERIHFGHAGDLHQVNEYLANAIRFLEGDPQ